MSLIRFILVVSLVLKTAAEGWAQARPTLKAISVNSNGWFQLQIQNPTNLVYTVQSSADLRVWQEKALLIGPEGDKQTPSTNPLPFVDLTAAGRQRSFYRVQAASIKATNDWKNVIFFEGDQFLSPEPEFGQMESRWIKFMILTNEPHRVYFQDSVKYAFHYDFAAARLGPFRGMSREAFDQATLRTNGQQAVSGAVLFSPLGDVAEYGIQIVGLDAYPREQIESWFKTVQAAVAAPAGVKAFYFPTYEQSATAELNRPYFLSRGIEVSSAARWVTGDVCYSEGWALGVVKFIPVAQIDAAYADGRLRPQDILLTDGIPAELPFVSGIITLVPATPNSHVALLAKSYKIPFVFFNGAEDRARAQALAGKEIALQTEAMFGACQIMLADVSQSSSALKAEILNLKKTPPIQFAPKERATNIILSTEQLVPADIRFVGGKAAHYGILRRKLPTNSAPAVAITFNLWDDFMQQMLPSGKTLRGEIAGRLQGYAYPPNMLALRNDLAGIRSLITDSTIFTPEQTQAVISGLSMFSTNKNIRFRSSSNLEDSETFTGAGLYDSYSGCLADDLDGDASGPSICDPTERNERGVFRAIRKVYASFYNDNAFLERLRHGVDESKVGMALLVHHSSPDEIELANGVATAQVNPSSTFRVVNIDMVTQKGAVSVTNPDSTARPEVVNINLYPTFQSISLKERSSLVPLGGHVMEFETNYLSFAQMFSKVATGFEELGRQSEFYLDFEYKKVDPGALIVKQVRPIPSPTSTNLSPVFLLNEPQTRRVFQGEFGTVLGNHRLKSQWTLHSRELRLHPTNLQQTLYTNVQVAYLEGSTNKSLSGSPSAWPGAKFLFTNDPSWGPSTRDEWRRAPADSSVLYALLTRGLALQARGNEPVLRTLGDLELEFEASYTKPMLVLEYGGSVGSTTNETVRLLPPQAVTATSLLQTREFTTNKLALRSTFYWPEPPKGASAGYTAPLVDWVETRLERIASQPIVLKGYYSQTYRPEHHNFSEHFLFEPGLEPGLPVQVLNELRQADIKMIYLYYDKFGSETMVKIIGFDDRVRPL